MTISGIARGVQRSYRRGRDKMAISDEQLAEWERLAQQATPGPWTFKTYYDASVGHLVGLQGTEFESDSAVYYTGYRSYDGRFMAEARTMVPALIAEVRRLKEEVELLDETLADFIDQ